jgi:hypothetical protein
VSREALAPDTVQIVGVNDAKLTGNPELAVADSGNVFRATSVAVIAGNVMVCGVNVTVKLRETVLAA